MAEEHLIAQEVGRQGAGEEPPQRRVDAQEEQEISSLHGGRVPSTFGNTHPNGGEQLQSARGTDGIAVGARLHAEVKAEGLSGINVQNADGDDIGEWNHELILSNGVSWRLKPDGKNLFVLLGKNPSQISHFEPAKMGGTLTYCSTHFPYNVSHGQAE